MIRRPPRSTRTDTLFPYTTLFRSSCTTPTPPLKRRGFIDAIAPSPLPLQPNPLRPRRAFRARSAGQHHGKCYRHRVAMGRRGQGEDRRSEEHTSELQSLMRISYAVFCLKKKNKNKRKINNNQK